MHLLNKALGYVVGWNGALDTIGCRECGVRVGLDVQGCYFFVGLLPNYIAIGRGLFLFMIFYVSEIVNE
ncbi:hypothetical protein GCM10009865_50460 [Aeromicrobium ponti]